WKHFDDGPHLTVGANLTLHDSGNLRIPLSGDLGEGLYLDHEHIQVAFFCEDNSKLGTQHGDAAHNILNTRREERDTAHVEHIIGSARHTSYCAGMGAPTGTRLMRQNGIISDQETQLRRRLGT